MFNTAGTASLTADAPLAEELSLMNACVCVCVSGLEEGSEIANVLML